MINPKLIEAAKARRDRHGSVVMTLDLFISILQEADNPSEYSYQPPAAPPQLYVPPEFPKKKIRLNANKQIVEERIVHTHAEETELRKSGEAWYTFEGV
jgi:hypothetical protein